MARNLHLTVLGRTPHTEPLRQSVLPPSRGAVDSQGLVDEPRHAPYPAYALKLRDLPALEQLGSRLLVRIEMQRREQTCGHERAQEQRATAEVLGCRSEQERMRDVHVRHEDQRLDDLDETLPSKRVTWPHMPVLRQQVILGVDQ